MPTRLLAAALLVVAFALPAQGQLRYGWTLSASETDPHQNQAPARAGQYFVYLWFSCNDLQKLCAAEFAVSGEGLHVVTFTPMNDFLNAGEGSTELLLAPGGPADSPIVAGKFLVQDPGTGGGRLCLAPSQENGWNVSVNCERPLETHPNDWVGYGSGIAPCKSSGGLCESVLEEASWGTLKTYYRDR